MMTPLLAAVKDGSFDMTEYLVKVGCNKEAKDKVLLVSICGINITPCFNHTG